MTSPIKSLIQTMRELREKAIPNARIIVDVWLAREKVKMEEAGALGKVSRLQIMIAEAISTYTTNQERLEKALEIAAEALDLLLRTGTGGHNLCDSGDCHIARAHSKGSRMMFEIEATLRGEK